MTCQGWTSCAWASFSSTKLGMPMLDRNLFHVLPFGSTCKSHDCIQARFTANSQQAPAARADIAKLQCLVAGAISAGNAVVMKDPRFQCKQTISQAGAHPPRGGDDDRDGQQHVVGVDQPRDDARVPGKGGVDCIVGQYLQHSLVCGTGLQALWDLMCTSSTGHRRKSLVCRGLPCSRCGRRRWWGWSG